MFIALAAVLASGLAQGTFTGGALQPTAYAAVGAVTCMLCIMVHHPSTALPILATAVLVTLADAGGWAAALAPGAARATLAFNGAIFAAAYVVTRPCACVVVGAG